MSEQRNIALFELLVWSHKVEPWCHSWYRGRVDTLDAKYNLAFINSTLYVATPTVQIELPKYYLLEIL